MGCGRIKKLERFCCLFLILQYLIKVPASGVYWLVHMVYVICMSLFVDVP